MTGEKLPLVVIGQSKQPRCFPKDPTKLPTVYKSNKKAWMTGSLFKEWLQELDSQLTRRIAMVVDNCPAHPRI